jgi:hypothetical protein
MPLLEDYISRIKKAGDWDTAKQRFAQYNRAGGAVNPGLVNRRAAELGWLNEPQPGPANVAQNGQSFPPPMALGGPKPEDQPMGILSRPKIDPQEELMGILGNQGSQAGWNALTQLGAGIAAGANQGWGPGIGLGLSNASEAMQGGQNQRLKALQMMAENSRAGTTDGIREYQFALGQGFKGNLQDFLQQKRATNSFEQYSKAGAVFQGDDGQYYTLRLAGDGTQKLEPVGKGMKPARGFVAVGDDVLDKGAGTLTGTDLGPAIAGEAAAKTRGEAQGAAQIDIPRIEANAERALKTIQQIRAHPGKQYGVGITAASGYLPQTSMRGFKNLVDQAKGQTFLEAFNSLRGGGQITEAEGQKATQALARLDTAQSQEDFDAALKDLESVVVTGLNVARRKAAGGSAPAASDALKSKYGLE